MTARQFCARLKYGQVNLDLGQGIRLAVNSRFMQRKNLCRPVK